MDKRTNKIFILLGVLLLIGACSAGTTTMQKEDGEQKEMPSYIDLTPASLHKMLSEEEVILVDVHIPEQPHIPGTDFVIPYNDTEALLKALPDKKAKIVLYCRSGHMSKIAAAALAERGYTNLYNLDGGENAWRATGYEVER